MSDTRAVVIAAVIMFSTFIWYRILIPALAATGYYWCALLAIIMFAAPIVTVMFAGCYYLFNKFTDCEKEL